MEPTPLPGVVQETRGFNVIFIHSTLDDAGLSAAEFRVYAHLARRASNGAAWPSVRSIAAACRLNKDTVCEALNVLESRQMMRREKRGFSSTVYFLTAVSEWLSESEGQDNLSGKEGQSVRKEGTATVRKEGTEGNPVEGNPKKVLHPPGSTPPATGGRDDWKKRRLPESQEALRISAIFDRPAGKPWSEQEIVLFRQLCPFEPAELRSVERFYEANLKRSDNPARCRLQLFTLLQNWQGEVEKAGVWCRSHPERRAAAAAAREVEEPEGFRSWFTKNYSRADPKHPWKDIPADIKKEYLSSLK